MSAEILRMEQIVVEAHGGRRLIDGVDLHLRQGEVLGLIGESGAGKSTLALAAMGHARRGCRITGGKILFGGSDIRTLPAAGVRSLRGNDIAYVAQSAAAAFNPALRLGRQIREAVVVHGRKNEAQARADAIDLFHALELPAPERFGERYPHQVSGGQLQRAMVAMAMLSDPQILILDEPTTALDVTTQIEVLALIRKLVRGRGTAALYITHDLAVVAQLADRIMVLRDGRMVEQGETEAILDRPAMPYTRALVSVRAPLPRAAADPGAAPRALLQLRGVHARYASLPDVVKDIDLTVFAGQTTAIVGESGSGKTALARVVTGLLPRSKGEILFRGEPLAPELHRRPHDMLRRLQIVHQMPDTALNPRQTVAEIVGRPLQVFGGLSARDAALRVAELLGDIELAPELATRLPDQLSGGQKQRVCIARALAAEPDLIICDEVTSALDPLIAREILRLLLKLQRERQCSYLFISHDLSTVRDLADRVLIMKGGRAIAEGPCEQVFSPPLHPYTERLMLSVPEMRRDWLDDVLASSRQVMADTEAVR